MNPCAPLRAFLYSLLFVVSAVLLGLTAYRISYTRSLSGGDILTNRSHFYDPVIVLLLVTACLGLIFPLVVIPFLFAKGGSPARWITEHVLMWPLWIMLLVGAAVMTHKWHNLKWCRGSYRVCRILESIKAFSWITWGILTLALLASIIHWFTSRNSNEGGAYRAETYPETRQTTTGGQAQTVQTTTVNTTRTRPVGETDANVHAAAVA